MNSTNVGKKAVYFIVSMLLISWSAYAGNIDPGGAGDRYAWGENIGWINLEPALGPGVNVTDTALTGAAWSENAGWITMDPAYGGVVNDGTGNLSGYAWGENVGWISFSCQDRDTCAAAQYGVVIDPCGGTFSGMAWGENIGWINFSSVGAAPFQIVTAWRLDTDNDGTPDCSDNCPSDPAKTEPGACDCGSADTDTDGDGTPDCSDNCPSDPAKTEPGACDCGSADTDTDGDGTPDCSDNTKSGGGGGGGGCFIRSLLEYGQGSNPFRQIQIGSNRCKDTEP